MKMIKFIVACFCISTILISCASMRAVNTSNLHLGMNKAEVQTALRKNPDNTIAAKSYSDGNLEVVQYSDLNNGVSLETAINPYWLYFFNDKLVKWEPRPKGPQGPFNYDFLDNVHYNLEHN
ncbi:hypothetical protein [Rhizosphaericola mali]|uniref:DUF3192 domain-containing protein n=1 Tax=Rhizosphaericola mali TaxID=2545455 RepID=A0A5P2G8N8_9BACT|nr:hypothetical protein [Rhizosphaericola mali]QES90292.1 hypothetical protein E0W69_017085 [Rhizosphaericola mali]